MSRRKSKNRRKNFRVKWRCTCGRCGCSKSWIDLGSETRVATFPTLDAAKDKCSYMLRRYDSHKLFLRVIAPNGKPVAVTKVVREVATYRVRRLVAVKQRRAG